MCHGASLFYDAKDQLQIGMVVLVFRAIKGHTKSGVCYFGFLHEFTLIFLMPAMWKSLPLFLLSFRTSFARHVCTLPLSSIVALFWNATLCRSGNKILSFLWWSDIIGIRENTPILGFILMFMYVPISLVLLYFQTFYEMSLSLYAAF